MNIFKRLFALVGGRLRMKGFGDVHAGNGLQALDTKDYRQAVAELELAVKQGVKSYDLAELYTILGMSYKNLGQFQDAIIAHQKALNINPEYHKAWNNLGIAYLESNHYQEAERCIKRALEYSPNYVFSHVTLGIMYIYLERPQEAIAMLEKATSINPSMGAAHGNLALAYAMVRRFEDARRSLKQAIVLGNENWEELTQRVGALEQLAAAELERDAAMRVPLSSKQAVLMGNTSVQCSHCGQHNAVNAVFCVRCGARLERVIN